MYFRLKGQSLIYFDNDNGVSCVALGYFWEILNSLQQAVKGHIPLKNMNIEENLDGYSPLVFMIDCKVLGKKFYLRGKDAAESSTWITAIKDGENSSVDLHKFGGRDDKVEMKGLIHNADNTF